MDHESRAALSIIEKESLEREIEDKKERLARAQAHHKAVEPYTDGLPYSKDRVIAAAKDKLYDSLMSTIECGKYLIWLQAEEGVQALALILNEHFSMISRRTAFNYMRLAKISVEHPKMQMLAEKQRSKAIALLEILNNEDIEALETGELVAGIKLDDVEKIPWRELKDKLRSYRQTIDRGQEQLNRAELKIKDLEKSLADDRKRLYGDVIVKFPPEDQKAMEQLHYAHDQIWLALASLAMIDKKEASMDVIIVARDLCLHLRQLAVEKYTEFGEARPEIPQEAITEYWEETLPFNAQLKPRQK